MQPTTDKRAHQQLAPYAFKRGQSGNPKGRPKGMRNKLSEAFVADLYKLWQEDGIEVMRRAAAKSPADILRVVASLVPKDFNLNVDVRMTHEQALQALE